MEVEPSEELKSICKYWIPFLQKSHKRAGVYNKQQLDIYDTSGCMVGEAWGFTSQYSSCEQCRLFACDLDSISEYNKSYNITPKQVSKMIRKGNTFATHYLKKHGGSK